MFLENSWEAEHRKRFPELLEPIQLISELPASYNNFQTDYLP